MGFSNDLSLQDRIHESYENEINIDSDEVNISENDYIVEGEDEDEEGVELDSDDEKSKFYGDTKVQDDTIRSEKINFNVKTEKVNDDNVQEINFVNTENAKEFKMILTK